MYRINNEIRIKAIETIINFAINFKFYSILKTCFEFVPTKDHYITLFGYPISLGNSKLDYVIANITSAMECFSDQLGLCLALKCYAKTAECYKPGVWDFRERQSFAWNKLSAEKIALSLYVACLMFGKKIVRFQESGDFRYQSDINKLIAICKILNQFGIKVYTYSARIDLDFSELKNVCTIHISNSKQASKHNLPYTRIMKVKGFCRLKPIEKKNVWKKLVKSVNKNGKNEILCPMDCTTCKACLSFKYNVVFIGH